MKPNVSELEKQLAAWFAGQIPDDWFTGPVTVDADREEILVCGDLPEPSLDGAAGDDERATARAARIARFREDTRAKRMNIAAAAEERSGTKVSWAVTCGGIEGRREVFTNVSAPVMTRLRMSERQVLDTLVDASVARSRSDALAWCVRLVGQHQGDWIQELRDAMVHVQRVREAGPKN